MSDESDENSKKPNQECVPDIPWKYFW
jgi:hypothetical protein